MTGEPEFHKENVGCKACRARQIVNVLVPSEHAYDQPMVKKNGVDVPVLLKKIPEDENRTESTVTPIKLFFL